LINFPIPGNDDSTKSIRIIVDVILEAIQTGSSKRVEAPTRRKDITPVTQEPDFIDQEGEPEVTLPEGYEETDFDDRRPRDDSPSTIVTEPSSTSAETSQEVPKAEEPMIEESKETETAPAEEKKKS
ncbi:MAG: 30S ribosomal protein S2, partial [Opitutae bacterium]|nr:30S ribosomal protein S2 [Opitutae bacterium]